MRLKAAGRAGPCKGWPKLHTLVMDLPALSESKVSRVSPLQYVYWGSFTGAFPQAPQYVYWGAWGLCSTLTSGQQVWLQT